jgi:hypothetical protein
LLEMKDNEYKYIQFPLSLLWETFTDIEKGLNLIIDFGIINFAIKQKFELSEVARQMMYSYYREKNILPAKLTNLIDNEITIDEDYNGFSGENFNPDGEVSELIEVFQKDTEFKDLAILFYQVRQAAKLLNVNIGSFKTTEANYKKGLILLNAFESKYGADCWPSCKITMLFDFRDNSQDIEILRCFIAIKSLIGQYNYIATTRNVILMRMFGCKSKTAQDSFLIQNKQAKAIFDKYTRTDKSIRYHFDKLFESLLNRGFLKSKIFERSISRKIFLSQKLSYDELASEIIKFRSKTKRNRLKDEQKAIERIRASI